MRRQKEVEDDPRRPQKNNDDEDEHPFYEDAPINQGLLSGKQKLVNPHYQHGGILDPGEWKRPYWLGAGLFLILFAFWLLDSLKDPIFVRLIDGKISEHQPPAKLCSVFVTLCLVCLLEFWTNLRQEHKRQAQLDKDTNITSDDEVLDPGGVWKRVQIKSASLSSSLSTVRDQNTTTDHRKKPPEHAQDDIVSFEMFYYVGVPYLVAFSLLSYFIWRFEQKEYQELTSMEATTGTGTITTKTENPLGYYILGYVLYATVESFGSLAVATFWSYTNSTLSLRDAERYYGPIIATAQLGAIGGSTLVATGRWQSSSLLTVVVLSILLELILMRGYDIRFEPTSILVVEHQQSIYGSSKGDTKPHHYNDNDDDTRSILTLQDDNATLTKPFWSGLYLIFKHSYVLLILGVSCLYEVAMTLLDYQMKLLGFAKFNDDHVATSVGIDMDGLETVNNHQSTMSFSKFMGHYGQVVNVTSLLFSSLLFPLLISKLGLRKTLLWFPTMLLLVTFLAYGVLPGNLTVLFVSLSLLKAMTYSVHDPSKELLYIPTSNAVKFRSKFWIDVVGERISKAIGSAFNTLANNIEQSVKIGTIPSLLTAIALWVACYRVGLRFDELLVTGKIVGLEHSIDPSTYSRVPNDDEDDGCYDNKYDYRYRDDDEPSEVEINFMDEDAVSTLDLMADPTMSSPARKRNEDDAILRGIEMPPLHRI